MYEINWKWCIKLWVTIIFQNNYNVPSRFVFCSVNVEVGNFSSSNNKNRLNLSCQIGANKSSFLEVLIEGTVTPSRSEIERRETGKVKIE